MEGKKYIPLLPRVTMVVVSIAECVDSIGKCANCERLNSSVRGGSDFHTTQNFHYPA